MKVVKSLHAGILHRTTEVFEQRLFTLTGLWGFELTTGEPVLEKDLWQSVTDAIAEGEVFDPGMPKVRGEYLLSGHFKAPDNKPVPGGLVSVSVGSLKKELAVFGDRYWTAGSFSDPEPITDMPITYDRAFGGEGYERNPAGKGMVDVDVQGVMRRPLPNVEYANRVMTSASDRPMPASLGRLDVTLPQRQMRAGTYDQTYIEKYMPGFPPDLDPLYFNEAADDQWFDDFLTGTERFRIEQMNADHPVLSGTLPGVRARLFIELAEDETSQVVELDNQLDTVWFLPNHNLGILIHRGSYALSDSPGATVKSAMIAHEYQSDPARDTTHYEDQLIKRTDPEHGVKYMMNTRDLLPYGVTCGFDALNEKSGLPMEGMASDNLQQFVENTVESTQAKVNEQMEEAYKTASDSGLDPALLSNAVNTPAEKSTEQEAIEAILNKVMPGYNDPDQAIDYAAIDLKALDELTEYLDSLKADKEAEVDAAVRERIEQLRQQEGGESVADQIEAQLDAIKNPSPLPRIARELDAQRESIRQQWAENEKQMMVMQSMGADISGIQQQMPELAQMETYLDDAQQQAEMGYRNSAHSIEQAASPHPGEEAALRSEFDQAVSDGTDLRRWDGAFVDLASVRVAQRSLQGALLEHSNLAYAQFTDVDFSEAVLAHADLSNTRFVRCTFKDANLGRCRLKDAYFDDCDFTNSILSNAAIEDSEFSNCLFSDRQDTFLETQCLRTRFTHCEMKRGTFYQMTMTGSQFTHSILDESNFLECDLRRCGFENTALNGVNLVSTDLTDADFSHAEAHNIRFVNGCTLEGARFYRSDVKQSNFRECALKGADFTEANLDACDFSDADLRQAVLTGAQARQSMFYQTNLEQVEATGFNAMEASFQDARMPGAVFQKANLYSANLYGVTVGDTDFRQANLKKTLFKDWRPDRE